MKSDFPILLLALCDPAKTLSLSGVIHRLRREIPHARITLVTTPASAELFQDDPAIDETRILDGAIFRLKALGQLSELSRRDWGLLVDIGPTMVSRMIRSKTRFVLDANNPAGPLQQICRKLALDIDEVKPQLVVSDTRTAQVRKLLDHGKDIGKLLVIAPGATWLGRRWPTERYAVLATRLMREGGPFANHNLLIIGNEADHDTAVALRMATPRAQVLELTGKFDLLGAYAALRHGAAFIGNDEIWLHLAAAAGIPAFGLFGPSDDHTAPVGDNVHIVRGPRSFEEIRAADPKLKQNVCHMLDLSIDTVFDAVVSAMPASAQEIAAHETDADEADDVSTEVKELGHA